MPGWPAVNSKACVRLTGFRPGAAWRPSRDQPGTASSADLGGFAGQTRQFPFVEPDRSAAFGAPLALAQPQCGSLWKRGRSRGFFHHEEHEEFWGGEARNHSLEGCSTSPVFPSPYMPSIVKIRNGTM